MQDTLDGISCRETIAGFDGFEEALLSPFFELRTHGLAEAVCVYGITHLGYPIYFLTILGVWKILGVVGVLIPRFPVRKEWAYAGLFFAMTGAAFSHIAVGDPVKELAPSLLLLVLTVVSWYFRPAGRKIPALRIAEARETVVQQGMPVQQRS